jgi:hypothetical protein
MLCPRAAAEFLEMPGHIARLEQDVYGIKQDMKEVLNLVRQEIEDKSLWEASDDTD